MSSPRRLVLVGNFLLDRQESMQRFNQMLSDGFTGRGWQVETWRPEPRFTKWVRTYRYGGVPKYLGYLDKFYVFPRLIRRRRRQVDSATIYHITDHSNAVYAPHFQGAHLTVTCHDLLQVRSALGEFPKNRVSGTGQRYQRWILDHLAQAPQVVCVSEKTREDLLRLTPRSENSTPVVYLGLNYPYRPMNETEADGALGNALQRNGHSSELLATLKTGRFILGVGGAHWYKNRTGLVSIFSALQKFPRVPSRLVYVGPPLDAEQEAILSAHGLSGSLVRLAGVSNEELRATYSLAAGLLFPSWEEGFGWPIVEAQACGCPVFTSNRKPMTEIGGSAACYFDPSDAAGAASVIAAALPNADRMAADGLQQCVRWDVTRMLGEYEHLYTAGARHQRVLAPVRS